MRMDLFFYYDGLDRNVQAFVWVVRQTTNSIYIEEKKET